MSYETCAQRARGRIQSGNGGSLCRASGGGGRTARGSQARRCAESKAARTQAERCPRFPRPCRGRSKSLALIRPLPRKRIEREPLTGYLAHSEFKPLGIGKPSLPGLGVVVAERLLIQVAEQVERLDCNVGAVQPTFNEAPEVFHAVGVDLTVNVLGGVINDSAQESVLQPVVARMLVGHDLCATPNMLADEGLQRVSFAARYNMGAYLSATLQQPKYDGLAFAARADPNALRRNSCISRALPPMKASSTSTRLPGPPILPPPWPVSCIASRSL